MNQNYAKRIRYIREQIKILSLLIKLFQIDKKSVLKLVEDAQNQQNLLVPNYEQQNWISKLRQDKLKRLAAKIQSNQRYQAANIVNQNDVDIARRSLNLPRANPFKQPPKKPLPVIKV